MGIFETGIKSLAEVLGKSLELSEKADEICAACAGCIARGGTIFSCGNGGSAADAMHFAEELSGKYRLPRKALRGVCLNSDAAALTCIANDFGYENVFSRQIEALAREGDIILCFSSSGESENLVRAILRARELGIVSIALSGRGGGTDALLTLPAGEPTDRTLLKSPRISVDRSGGFVPELVELSDVLPPQVFDVRNFL